MLIITKKKKVKIKHNICPIHEKHPGCNHPGCTCSSVYILVNLDEYDGIERVEHEPKCPTCGSKLK